MSFEHALPGSILQFAINRGTHRALEVRTLDRFRGTEQMTASRSWHNRPESFSGFRHSAKTLDRRVPSRHIVTWSVSPRRARPAQLVVWRQTAPDVRRVSMSSRRESASEVKDGSQVALIGRWFLNMVDHDVFRWNLRPNEFEAKGARSKSEVGIPSLPRSVRSNLYFPVKPVLSSMGAPGPEIIETSDAMDVW